MFQTIQSQLTAVGGVGAWRAARVRAVGWSGVFGGVRVGLQKKKKKCDKLLNIMNLNVVTN